MSPTNSTSENPVVQIANGPGISELINALVFAFDRTRRFRVEFTERTNNGRLTINAPVTAQIIGLTYESDTPGMFCFTANFQRGDGQAIGSSWQAEGFYDARKRVGWYRPAA